VDDVERLRFVTPMLRGLVRWPRLRSTPNWMQLIADEVIE
jgi:hypothetical protein